MLHVGYRALRDAVGFAAYFRDCSEGLSEVGWMTRDLFVSWLKTVFVPAVVSKQIKRPVLLFVDGSATHKSQQASDFCLANGILLYCLQPNATHLIQPLELSFFGSLKHHWGKAVMDHQTKNPGMSVTKSTFSLVFKTAYEKSCLPEVARVGFEQAGLFPFCKEAVLNSKKMEASRLLVASPTSTSPSVYSSFILFIVPFIIICNSNNITFNFCVPSSTHCRRKTACVRVFHVRGSEIEV